MCVSWSKEEDPVTSISSPLFLNPILCAFSVSGMVQTAENKKQDDDL